MNTVFNLLSDFAYGRSAIPSYDPLNHIAAVAELNFP